MFSGTKSESLNEINLFKTVLILLLRYLGNVLTAGSVTGQSVESSDNRLVDFYCLSFKTDLQICFLTLEPFSKFFDTFILKKWIV